MLSLTQSQQRTNTQKRKLHLVRVPGHAPPRPCAILLSKVPWSPELTNAKPAWGPAKRNMSSPRICLWVSLRKRACFESPCLQAQGLGRRLTHCRLVQWLLEKGRMNAEATIKASGSEAMLQLSGNNLDSYSCHHLARASFLISFGSSHVTAQRESWHFLAHFV